MNRETFSYDLNGLIVKLALFCIFGFRMYRRVERNIKMCGASVFYRFAEVLQPGCSKRTYGVG